MPKFELNKLVRDGFVQEYERSNQKAEYIKLSPSEHKKQLVRKIVEESQEIGINDPKEELAKEIADIEQILSDLKTLCEISDEQVETAKQRKFERIGGFAKGVFVDTLELADDDKWVDYYRTRPDVFPEI